MAFEGIGQALAALGTLSGVWAVVMLFRWFQRDFSSVYRQELLAERARVDDAERTADTERIKRLAAENRVAVLEHELARHGIALP